MFGYKPAVGDKVVITETLHYGREGVIIKKGWIFWHVKCKSTDGLGRPMVRVTHWGMKPMQEDLELV